MTLAARHAAALAAVNDLASIVVREQTEHLHQLDALKAENSALLARIETLSAPRGAPFDEALPACVGPWVICRRDVVDGKSGTIFRGVYDIWDRDPNGVVAFTEMSTAQYHLRLAEISRTDDDAITLAAARAMYASSLADLPTAPKPLARCASCTAVVGHFAGCGGGQ